MSKIGIRPETNTLYFDFRVLGIRCREQTPLRDTKETHLNWGASDRSSSISSPTSSPGSISVSMYSSVMVASSMGIISNSLPRRSPSLSQISRYRPWY
ncbi:Arm DNA-binding domain-containing protein [Polynucleobacter sp. P1-05-14]|uniref:Arm DNA-binding domain-containing protein n=1 Tax=Polynucleobacter sp. P1-05-14 TaxID=1819732 RepID=UPI001C0BA835|nr:DUF3596 domain-containing protein [Polynucleobacter sp. P1-05-14]